MADSRHDCFAYSCPDRLFSFLTLIVRSGHFSSTWRLPPTDSHLSSVSSVKLPAKVISWNENSECRLSVAHSWSPLIEGRLSVLAVLGHWKTLFHTIYRLRATVTMGCNIPSLIDHIDYLSLLSHMTHRSAPIKNSHKDAVRIMEPSQFG